ncbi:hypothetical protein C8Q72DRAFT_936432 [Fomitopsis betulina]|nr:hypothetical protein C8Q72DRAFT_936432 [Fomitopsis betulina]
MSEMVEVQQVTHPERPRSGIMWVPVDQLGPDNHDLQWFTNVIGPFLFMKLLLPVLISGKATSPNSHTHIITTLSSSAYVHMIKWDMLKDRPTQQKLLSNNLYSQSKFVWNIDTDLMCSASPVIKWFLVCRPPIVVYEDLMTILRTQRNYIVRPMHLGALTQLWAGMMPEALTQNAGFLILWACVGRCRKEAYDSELGERLWGLLEETVKDKQVEKFVIYEHRYCRLRPLGKLHCLDKTFSQ